MFMKDIDQQLQFDVKSWTKLVNFNNIKIAVVNFENIKKKLSFKYHNYLNVFDWIQINQLVFHRDSDHKIELLNKNFHKVEHIEYCYISLKKLKNISSRIYSKILSRWIKFYIFYRYYSQWKLTKIYKFASIIENSTSWQNEIKIFCFQ